MFLKDWMWEKKEKKEINFQFFTIFLQNIWKHDNIYILKPVFRID